MEQGGRRRVLLVEDVAAVRGWIRAEVEDHPELVVVGEACSGEEALVQSRLLQPDLVLMDIGLPGMNGLEATRRLKSQPAPPRVVILTLHEEEEYRIAAAAAGADGFVGKGQMGSALLPVVQQLFGRWSRDGTPPEQCVT